MSYENESNRGQLSKKKLVYLDASCEKCIRLAGSQSQRPCKVHPSTCLQRKPYSKEKLSADDCSSSVLWFRAGFCFVLRLDSSELGSLTIDGSVTRWAKRTTVIPTTMGVKQPWRYQDACSPRTRRKPCAGLQDSLPLSLALVECKLTEATQSLPQSIILSED